MKKNSYLVQTDVGNIVIAAFSVAEAILQAENLGYYVMAVLSSVFG